MRNNLHRESFLCLYSRIMPNDTLLIFRPIAFFTSRGESSFLFHYINAHVRLALLILSIRGFTLYLYDDDIRVVLKAPVYINLFYITRRDAYRRHFIYLAIGIYDDYVC